MRSIECVAGALALCAGLAAGAAAQPPAQETQAQSQADATAKDKALLAALLQRRAAMLQSEGSEEARRTALAFLDKQIAEVKGRLGE